MLDHDIIIIILENCSLLFAYSSFVVLVQILCYFILLISFYELRELTRLKFLHDSASFDNIKGGFLHLGESRRRIGECKCILYVNIHVSVHSKCL